MGKLIGLLFLVIVFLLPQLVNAQSISIDSSKVVAINQFGTAIKLDHEWKTWRDSPALRQLMKDANFKMVNFYTVKSTSPDPCISWNPITKTGIFDWYSVDTLARNITSIGAQPILSLSLYNMTNYGYLCSGMPVNETSGLPYIDQFAAFAAEWPKHFKTVGIPIKYYEIVEEGFQYFGWNDAEGPTKLGYYVDVWNAAARAMREEDPTLKIGDDSITMTKVFDYWLTHGEDVGFLSFHKYDTSVTNTSSPNYVNDASILRMADSRCYEDSSSFYGIETVRQRWYDSRGYIPEVINHETNMNSHWEASGGPATDIRMRKMIGAVWNALMLRKSILENLKYTFFYSFGGSSTSYFGMVNMNTAQPYYPYYVYKWIGNNLDIGDSIVNSTNYGSYVISLAWINKDRLNILLIHNSTQTTTITLQGLTGQFNYSKLDDPSDSNYLNPIVQTGIINADDPMTLNGYSVVLLRSMITTSCLSCEDWTNASCGGICASDKRKQTRICNPVGCTPGDGEGYSRCIDDAACYQSDLVGYWKFDENSGSIIHDNSGNSNDGTLYGASWSRGIINTGLNFDGTNHYVEISDSTSLDITDAITIESWIYPTSWSSPFPRIVSKESGIYAEPYALELNNSGKSAVFCIDAGSGEACVNSGTNSISLYRWYHLVGTWNGTHMQIYINGTPRNTKSLIGTMRSTTNDVLIGNTLNLDRPFNGTIDEVRIYNRAIQLSEAISHYVEYRHKLYGQIKNSTNYPVKANITLSGQNVVNPKNQTDADGNYILLAYENIFDIQYNISNFYIRSFWIKLPYFNLNSDLANPVNYVNGYASQNKTSFTIDITQNQKVEVYSPGVPAKVLANGLRLAEVPSLSQLIVNTWYYNPTEKILYLIAPPV